MVGQYLRKRLLRNANWAKCRSWWWNARWDLPPGLTLHFLISPPRFEGCSARWEMFQKLKSWQKNRWPGDRAPLKIKMSTKLRAARKVAINHKALKPNNQKHSICLASLLFRRKSWPGRKILLHNFQSMVKRRDDFVATKFDGHWPAHVLSSSSRKTGILPPRLNYYVIDVWCIKMFLRCLASSWSSGIVIRWLRQRPRN